MCSRDVELVADVAVERIALGLDGGDRLARELERDRLVAQELPADRVRDDGALVADDRVVEPGGVAVRPHRAEHPAGDDDHVDPPPAPLQSPRECAAELGVLADQRPVEVAGERLDAAREVRREDQPLVAWTTYAATSWICCGVSWPANAGIGDLPFVTRSTTRSSGGFVSSRFGPTVPVAPRPSACGSPRSRRSRRSSCRRPGRPSPAASSAPCPRRSAARARPSCRRSSPRARDRRRR